MMGRRGGTRSENVKLHEQHNSMSQNTTRQLLQKSINKKINKNK